MIDSPLTVKDGDFQLLFSRSINVYSNVLLIQPLAGFKLKLVFKVDKNKQDTAIRFDGVNEQNESVITLTNFNHALGAATIKPVKIIKLTNGEHSGKSIYISVFSRALNDATTLLNVTVSIYLK